MCVALADCMRICGCAYSVAMLVVAGGKSSDSIVCNNCASDTLLSMHSIIFKRRVHFIIVLLRRPNLRGYRSSLQFGISHWAVINNKRAIALCK